MIKTLQKIKKQLGLSIVLMCVIGAANAQCVQSLNDDFESGLFGTPWSAGTGHTISVNNVAPAQGTFALNLSGNSGFYAGPTATFTSAQPTYISWRIKTNNTSVPNAYFVVGDANISTNNGILFAYMFSPSELRFYNTASYPYTITTNTWYNIEIKNINWTSKTFDIWINNVIFQTAFAFRSLTSTSVNQLHVFNLNAGATSSYDNIIIGNQIPVVTASPSITTICPGASVTLNGAGAQTYTWTGGITNGTAFSPTISSTYTVTGIASNSCINTATASVVVNSNPTITAVSNSSIICIGQTASITANGASTYTWNTSATTTVIAVSPTITTSYTVNGTNSNGCVNSALFTQSVSACTGINQVSVLTSDLKVYPNPNNGDFILTTSTDINLNIVNSLGQLVKTVSLNESNSRQLTISNFANGIYYIVGQEGDQTIKQKIIVAK